ncbi:MAG: sigma-70 family RNA polymerase sigma factor [Pirellulaceae bacterium]
MDEHDDTDADLVARTLAGDREAFGRLYDRHVKKVRAVVVAVSGDWAMVDDMTQDCFLRGYRKLDTLRDSRRFGAWIAGIARQVARERRRTLKRDRHQLVGDKLEQRGMTPDGCHELQDAEQLELMLRKLAALPERERLAIHAFYFEEHDARRAAELLEVSRSHFYGLLKRALGRLHALLHAPSRDEEAKR